MWNILTPGLPTYGNYDAIKNFGNNPQIIMSIDKVTDC